MPDVGAWTAAATACAAAIGTVIAAARQPADVAALRAETKAAREALPADIKTAVDTVRAALDASIGDVRANLTSVAKRVGELESWRRTAHERVAAAESTGRSMIVSGSDLAAVTDKAHEHRIAQLEARADKSEARAERHDAAMTEARVSLGNVLGKLDAFFRERSNR